MTQDVIEAVCNSLADAVTDIFHTENYAKGFMKALASQGFTIVPTVTDEKVREAVDCVEVLVYENTGEGSPMRDRLATIKSALAAKQGMSEDDLITEAIKLGYYPAQISQIIYLAKRYKGETE